MDWIESLQPLNQVICTDEAQDMYKLYLSPQSVTIDDQTKYKYLEVIVYQQPSTAKIKECLIELQKEYDNSDEVNCFYINGEKSWIDKATRVGLVNSMNVLEAAGQTEYTVWFNGVAYTASIEQFKQVLSAVEIYAMQCYAVTEQHIADIQNLSTREEYLNYPIYEGYPEKLSFNLE